MKLLVTGATGMIGANLAMHLESLGHTVHALDAVYRPNLVNFKGFFYEGDIRSFDSPALGPLDAIFHQAAITDTSVTDQSLMFSVNVDAFQRILEFASNSGC